MRSALLGLLLTLSAAGAACAADYVVVASTDPGLKPGLELSSGERFALGAGRTATLMAAAGQVTTLRGGPSGAVAPALRTASADSARLEAVRSLIAPAPAGRTFGGLRGGVCPDASTLTSLDDILAVQAGGCHEQAKQALAALIARSSSGQ